MKKSGAGVGRLAKQHRLQASAERLSKESRFNHEECKVLLYIFDKITAFGDLDRLRMREILHTTFQITDDVMLDLVYKAFDRDNDGVVSDAEWVRGLSTMIRGDIDQLTEHCYFVYDMNGDGSLAREELTHCLKGCILAGYGLDQEEVEDCERDIVEICMKKLDMDRDGQITFPDFQNAVMEDPLMLQAIGPCLPGANAIASFLSLITDKFRRYTETYGRRWVRKKKQSMASARRSLRNIQAAVSVMNANAKNEQMSLATVAIMKSRMSVKY